MNTASLDFDELCNKSIPAPWIPPQEVGANFEEYDEDERVEPYQDDGTGWDAQF